MGKFVAKHDGVEYHYSVGLHDRPPSSNEKLDASKLDALVLEEKMISSPQASKLVDEMRLAGKPVYYVECRELHRYAQELGVAADWSYFTGAIAGPTAFLAGLFGASRAKILEEKGEKSRAYAKRLSGISRRAAFSGIAVTIGGVLSGVALGTDFFRT